MTQKIPSKFINSRMADDDELAAGVAEAKSYTDTKVIEVKSYTDSKTGDNTTAINQEITDRQNADTTLQSNIDTEASSRSSADTTLQNNIDAEATTRSNADTILQGNIDSETSSRESADTNLQNQINLKYDASNPNGYETPSQLNTRDTNNRNRSNHTGTQLSSTISDFVSTVLGTVISGVSFSTIAAITATDSILSALGKLQAQITNNTTNISTNTSNIATNTTNISSNTTAIGLRAMASRIVSAGTGLSGGGDLTADRTISMPNVGTSGTYGDTDKSLSVTTDAQGRVTNITPSSISILSSQVSNFASSVLAVLIVGVSTATSATITTSDSILSALGKLQAQINTMLVSTAPQSTGNANAAGTSSAVARADHVHKTVLANTSSVSTVSTTTTSTTAVLLNAMTLTAPNTGRYALTFTATVNNNTKNSETFFSVYVNNVLQNSFEASFVVGSSVGLNTPVSVDMNVDVVAGQSIEIRWRTTLGTATCNSRIMTIVQLS